MFVKGTKEIFFEKITHFMSAILNLPLKILHNNQTKRIRIGWSVPFSAPDDEHKV